jgi:hypothetical protein
LWQCFTLNTIQQKLMRIPQTLYGILMLKSANNSRQNQGRRCASPLLLTRSPYALAGGFVLRSLPDRLSWLSGRPVPPKPLVERFLRSRPDLRSLPERRSTLTMSASILINNIKVQMPQAAPPPCLLKFNSGYVSFHLDKTYEYGDAAKRYPSAVPASILINNTKEVMSPSVVQQHPDN